MSKLVYNTREVSKALNISMNKVYELIWNNEIPYVRVGYKYIIPKKELSKWLSKSSLNNK